MLICFDFDGVLANSAKTKFKIFKEAGERFLPREHKDDYLDFLNKNPNARREEKLSLIASNSNRNLEFLLSWFNKNYQIRNIELFQPTNEFLLNLKKYKTSIISAAPHSDLFSIANYSYLAPFSVEGIFANCNDKAKVLKQLKSKCSLETNESIFIGDTPSDYESARKASFIFIPLIIWSTYQWNRSKNYKPLNNLNNLFKHLPIKK